MSLITRAARPVTPPRPARPAKPRPTTPEDAAAHAAEHKAAAIRLHANAVPARAEAVVRQMLSPDFRNHDVLPGCAGGVEALAATMHWFDDAFSNQRVEVLHAVAEGDLVALHVAFTARHTGFFRGIAPSYRYFTVREMHMIRFAEGQEAEHWAVRDEAWLERELRGF